MDPFREMVEQAPIVMWRADAYGERVYVNAAWVAFTGRAQSQSVGRGWIAAVHPDDREEILSATLEHMGRREPYGLEYRLLAADDTYRQVHERAAPFTDASGAFAGYIGHCIDALERAASDVRTIADEFFEHSLDNVVVASLDGYFKRLNSSWTRTLGWSIEELMSRPSIEFVHPDDREAVLAARDLMRQGLPMGPISNRYLCKDGSIRWLDWRTTAPTPEGPVYAIARDVTAQKVAEEQLREARAEREKLQRQLVFADRMASIGTLAAGVAHEINNPLTYILGNLGLVLEVLGAPDARLDPQNLGDLRELTTEAFTGAERIQGIVKGLKTFSRSEEEQRAVIDVRPLLDLSIRMTANEVRHRGARLVTELEEIPRVDADEARLGQVFINLLINATQAFSDAHEREKVITVVTATRADGSASIEFRDTGPGIPTALVERVFDPFFTTKEIGVGTGLGLSICHSIVTALGGDITVDTAVGRGTTFRITLPAAEPASASPAASADAPPRHTRGARVLVVDDEPLIGALLRRLLRDHTVTAVTSASQALALLEQGETFDLIFSDLMMPEMSGMELFERLTARYPESADRVVFISGGAFTPDAAAFLDEVTRPCLDKPLEAKVVRALVDDAIR